MVVVFSPKRWRRKSKQSRSSGDEPSPPEAPTDTELTYENAPMQKHLLRGVNPRSGPTRCDDLDLKSRRRGLLGGAPPRGSHPPTIEFVAASKQATPIQETIGRSPRVLKRACCPPPLDFKPISSYTVFVSQARTYDASEMKPKKRVTTTTGLGLGLPSVTGARKSTRVRDDNDAHSLDLVGRLHPNYRPCPPKRSSSFLLAPEARPGPRPLQFPPAPQLRPIDLVEPLDHTPSPLELPSPPICDANNKVEGKVRSRLSTVLRQYLETLVGQNPSSPDCKGTRNPISPILALSIGSASNIQTGVIFFEGGHCLIAWDCALFSHTAMPVGNPLFGKRVIPFLDSLSATQG